MAKINTYEDIERPYGSNLERTTDNLVPGTDTDSGSFGVGVSNDGAGTTNPNGGGGVAEPAVTNEASMDDVWIKNVIRSINWKPKAKGFYIDGATGYAEFSNVFITGSLGVEEGATIAGWTVGAEEFSSGNVKLQSVAERILMGAATTPVLGTGIFMGKDGAAYKFRIGDPTAAYMSWDGSNLQIRNSVVTGLAAGTDVAVMSWQSTLLFAANGGAQVTWTSGVLVFHNGVTYNIVAGNTGAMTTKTYVYLDSDVSATELQITSTAANAIGPKKVIIAVAENVLNAGKNANFQVFGGSGGVSQLVNTNNIAANAITANEIQADSITASKINVSTLSSISANIGTITSGTITGALIRTSSGTSRVELDGNNNQLEIYRAGDRRILLKEDSLRFYNTSGEQLGYLTTPDASSFYIGSPNGNFLILNAEGSSYAISLQVASSTIVSISQSLVAFSPSGSQRMSITSSAITMNEDLNMSSNDIAAVRSITLDPRSSSRTSLTAPGMIFNSTSGGLDRFLGRPGDGTWTGSFDMTAV